MPADFWGQRFIIEALPYRQDVRKPRPSAVQGGALHISFNLNLKIDKDFAGVVRLPAASHEHYAREKQLACDVQKTGLAIKEHLLDPENVASLIYLYCHGRSNQPFQPDGDEALELDESEEITPSFLNNGGHYPNEPIVVINSCSSGAVSPLAFSSFLARFGERGARGLLSTSFAVPPIFAALFGQRWLDEYIAGKPVGDALHDLRCQALRHSIPLGLSTRCNVIWI